MKTCRVTQKEIERFGLNALKGIKKPFRYCVVELNKPDLLVFHTKVNLFGKILYTLIYPIEIFVNGVVEATSDLKWIWAGGANGCVTCTRQEVIEYYKKKLRR